MKTHPFCVLVFALCLLNGCTQPSPYGVVRVSGTVTLDGQAIEGVTVSFGPASGDGMSGVGVTDSAGRFVQTTGGAPYGTGCVPGKYNVAFSKIEALEADQTLSTEAYEKKYGDRRDIPMHYVVPEKYADAATSGLEPVEVLKDGKNEFRFDLSSK